jgi:hypothetical protein
MSRANSRSTNDAVTPRQVSLCEPCQNMREVRTARSRFLLCEFSSVNETYSKYPPQPVVQCDGYKAMDQPTGQKQVETGL